MLNLIDEIYPLVGDEEPILFQNALEEISDNISSYPEEIDMESVECDLGENVTRCILKWTWLSKQDDENPGKAFLEKTYDIESSISFVTIDRNECIHFFTSLPDKACREIYQLLKNDPEKFKLDRVNSSWHQIIHIYEGKYDTAKYLETCNKYLSENWHYGRPLIDHAILNKNYKQAEQYLVETFLSYLKPNDKGNWYPENSLFDTIYYHSHDEKEEVAQLLSIWSDVSKELGNQKRSVAAQIQGVILENPNDWECVINEYKKISDQNILQVIRPLFLKWKDRMSQRSLSMNIYSHSGLSSDTWVHWLIESNIDIEGKKTWFHEILNQWLNLLNKDETAFSHQWKMLSQLTKDLPGNEKIKSEYPIFVNKVLSGNSNISDLDKARISALEKVDAGEFLPQVMDIWKKCLCLIIPEPANARGSEYMTYAYWMNALFELNKNEYQRVLALWQDKHKRRKNLWRDMKSLKLPV